MIAFMDKPNLQFRFEEGGHRYTALADGAEVGFADIDPIGKDAVILKHTEVSQQHEGKGYAGALVKHVLEDSRARGRSVIPVCPYAASYIKRHPEYMDYVRESYRSVLTRG